MSHRARLKKFRWRLTPGWLFNCSGSGKMIFSRLLTGYRSFARGEHPIYLSTCGVNAQAMRTKTGDGPKSDVDLDRLLEDIKVVVRDGQELLKSSFTGVKERAIARAKTTDVTVREYPHQTLGIIFGVGLIVGLLCSGILSRGETMEED